MTLWPAPKDHGPRLDAMVRHLTLEANTAAYEQPPATDDRDPAGLITAAVDTVLATAETWLGWDGRPAYRDGNAWTPHKAIRRVADHLLDHLAEIECRLAGHPTIPDRWHGRMATTDADFARFTEIDLDEATSRAGMPVSFAEFTWTRPPTRSSPSPA